MDSKKGFMLKVLANFKFEFDQKIISDSLRDDRLREAILLWPNSSLGRQPPVFLQVTLKPDQPLMAVSYERSSEDIAEFEVIDLDRQESQDRVDDFTSSTIESIMPHDPLVCRALISSADFEFYIGEQPLPRLDTLRRRKYKVSSDKAAEIVVYTTPDIVSVLKKHAKDKLELDVKQSLTFRPSKLGKEEEHILSSLLDPSLKQKKIGPTDFPRSSLQSSLLASMPPELKKSEMALRSKLISKNPLLGVVEEIDKHFTQEGQDSVQELRDVIQAFGESWDLEFNQPISFSSLVTIPDNSGPRTEEWTLESSLDINTPLIITNY